jgi:hypothetical protein
LSEPIVVPLAFEGSVVGLLAETWSNWNVFLDHYVTTGMNSNKDISDISKDNQFLKEMTL